MWAMLKTSPALTDPDRPHLSYGKFAGYGAPVVPTLFGLPADMKQTVAVSDATDRPEHPGTTSGPTPVMKTRCSPRWKMLRAPPLG